MQNIVSGLPDFAVHAQLGLPPLPPDPFWPSAAALGFGPMFGLGSLPPNAAAAALGIPWGGKSPPPGPFHTLLSQYVLAGGALPLTAGLGLGGLGGFTLQPPPPPPPAAGSPSPTDGECAVSKSPPAPSPPPSSSSSETRKNSIEALRLRAKEHQALLMGQHQRLMATAAAAKPVQPVQAKS